MIEDRVSIALIPSSEHNDVEVSAQFYQHLLSIGSYINIPIANFTLESFEWYFYFITWSHNLARVD